MPPTVTNDSPEETFLAVFPTEKAWLANSEDTNGNTLARCLSRDSAYG